MIENSGPVIGAISIGGLSFPKVASILGLAFTFEMIAFSIGYRKSGAKGRVFGAICRSVSQVGLYGLCFWQAAATLGFVKL